MLKPVSGFLLYSKYSPTTSWALGLCLVWIPSDCLMHHWVEVLPMTFDT